tara:strand:+ start:591 stop:959 length:369 start_codon:yes stop_codon:yes gene_type:complete
MAPKLSKAKRPKRRWIGFSFPPSICSRNELEAHFRQFLPETIQFRLYDAHFFGSEVVMNSCEFQSIKEDIGIGIVCVNLVDYGLVRNSFSEQTGKEKLNSLSSSGKIRLVRQRLCLPKPRKK